MGKEDKNPPDIPGVQRGKDFWGKTVESAGQVLASRRRVKYGSEPPDLCVIDLAKSHYLHFPHLGRDKQSSKFAPHWEPRVDPKNGAVITWRWQELSEKKKDIQYLPFAGKKLTRDTATRSLNEIPESWVIALLVPQRVEEGIEVAMRQQDEIAHDYREGVGPESDRVRDAFDQLFDLSGRFVMGEIQNEQQLNEVSQEVERLLHDHGLLESRDPIWRRVVNHTLNAAQRDRINRVNNLVSRVRVRAAFLAATEREMIGKSVGKGAEKMYNYLALVRGVIRTKIKTAVEDLDSLCGFSRGVVASNELMRDAARRCTPEQARELDQYLGVVASTLENIQPAPYLEPVTAARALLIGEDIYGNPDDRTNIAHILAPTGKWYYPKQSARAQLRNLRPDIAWGRMYLAYCELDKILKNSRTEAIKVFDK